MAAICVHCLRRPPAFDAAWAPFLRRDAVRRGVDRLKYHADFPQLQVLSQLMAEALLARPGPRPDVLIPVPLPRRRLLTRGYNQALEIARRVGRVAAIPVDADAAHLLRTPRDQIGQSAAQRRRNLRGAFAVDPRVAGRHVALLDDVMTTGATLDALARAARQAGATRIEAWALAREPRVGRAT